MQEKVGSDQSASFENDQEEAILSFVGHEVSVTTTLLCYHNADTVPEIHRQKAWLCQNKTLVRDT